MKRVGDACQSIVATKVKCRESVLYCTTTHDVYTNKEGRVMGLTVGWIWREPLVN